MPPSRMALRAAGESMLKDDIHVDDLNSGSDGDMSRGSARRTSADLRGNRRGLYGSADAASRAPPQRPGGASSGSFRPSRPYPQPYDSGGPEAYDPTGDGRGGMAGLRDPYDKPTTSQLLGAQSRLRQDKASGALHHAAGRYRVLFGGHHAVHKGLRRSIADAYAAYVGQVVDLPEDSYALALRALDHTFNPGSQPPGSIDLNLTSSPFTTKPAKHAQVFNTAHRIMRDLGGYVYDVSYYCPGELDQLREMRRSEPVRTGGGYKSPPLVQTADPALQREAVAVRRRTPPRAPDEQITPGGVNPITGAVRPPGFDPSTAKPRARPSRPWTAPQPRGAAAVGGGRGGRGQAAVAARSVAAALDASAEAEAQEAAGGGAPDDIGPLEQRQRRGLRRLSSPGMFTKTPTHYRVSKLYEHVRPTEAVVKRMREQLVRQARRRMEPPADPNGATAGASTAAARAAAAPAAGGAGRRAGGDPAVDPATLAAMEQALAVGTRPLGARRQREYGAAGVRENPSYTGRPPQGATPAATVSTDPSGEPPVVGPAPPHDDVAATDRLLWIIETACELGLTEILGLEGPPPYPRSRRLSPQPHRRQFYDGVYGSPERYRPYTEEGGAAGAAAAAGYGDYGQGWYKYGKGHLYDEVTVRRLEEAEARRYVAMAAPVPEAQLYDRSRRVGP